MPKLFASRMVPVGEWVLIRRPTAGKSRLLVAEKQDDKTMKVTKGGPSKKCQGIVVSVGDGERAENGVLLPLNPNIRPGVTICFAEQAAFQLPDMPEMQEEELYFVPLSMVICAILPEGVQPKAAPPAECAGISA